MAKKRASGPAIGTPEIADVSSLREHPDNPRIGDVDAIAESVSTARLFWGALVVDASGQVLAGNHRLRAARKLGIERVPVVRVDVDEATAKRILVADNRLGETGDYDDAKLLALLRGTDDLAGTGYDDDDLAALIAATEGTDPEGALVAFTAREPEFATMTFIVHREDVETVRAALRLTSDGDDERNQNRNGRALVALCRRAAV